MKKLLITGVSGLLGLNLALETCRSYEVTGLVNTHPLGKTPFATRALELSAFTPVAQVLDEIKPDVVVNCAAITNLDVVESDPGLAWRLNAELPGFLAAECASRSIKLVHISTDAVFDGQSGNYSEEDAPNPINMYGRTKLAGEEAVLTANPQAIVARVVFYGWSLSRTRSLAEWFLNNLSAGHVIRGFTNILFCPLLVNQLSNLLVEMIDRSLAGLYHVVSRENISKYDFGVILAQQFGLDSKLIQPDAYQDSDLAARRSLKLILSTNKLARDLNAALPDIHSGIEQYYRLYREGFPEMISNFAV